MATLLKIDRFYNLKEITKVEFEECRVSSLDFHESGGFGLSVSHFFFQSYIYYWFTNYIDTTSLFQQICLAPTPDDDIALRICEGCTEDGKELVMEHLMKVIASTGQEYAWGSAIQFTARGSVGLEIKCTIFANKVFHSPKSNTSINTPLWLETCLDGVVANRQKQPVKGAVNAFRESGETHWVQEVW